MRTIFAALFALFLALAPSGASAAQYVYWVDASESDPYATGLWVPAGTSANWYAVGAAQLISEYGTYITGPNGNILVGPGANTELAKTILLNKGTISFGGTNPLLNFSVDAPVNNLVRPESLNYVGANWGALIGALSTIDEGASSPEDFQTAFVMGAVGSGTSELAGYLYLFINDYVNDDNTGGYFAVIETSDVPLPAALPLFGGGLMALAAFRRRKAA